jgi:putative transposase
MAARRDRSQKRVVDQAVMLRREVPTRSIRQIITILEMEGLVAPGEVKRSTLQDHLVKRGYGSKQLSMYHSTGAGGGKKVPASCTETTFGRWT